MLVNTTTHHVFCSIGFIPFQTLDQLTRRVPVTQMDRKVKLLEAIGVVTSIKTSENSAARYYVDLVDFWRNICVRLAVVRSADLDAQRFVDMSGVRDKYTKISDGNTNPPFLSSGLVSEFVNNAANLLLTIDHENHLSGCHPSGELNDYWLEEETCIATQVQDCSVYGILDDPWAPINLTSEL
ncbi:hypothetical protein Pmani_013345 [Petrolisthes manimaculis]|uniref:Uncharacterized protein n=1 Tax=Petrolisthes manimaculis TaxID=1843537 RepID=A0AAE1PW68_9EUCA|nr:hypothetical protein Pmani_013345 [Petrolisthes manimaculis]